MTNDLRERFAKKRAPLKAEEIMEAGYSYKEILALEHAQKIVRFKSGYYTCPDAPLTEEEIVFGMFPDGVFTMESALYLHGYLREKPFYWSIAISKNVSKSRFKIDYPLIHPFYCEESVLSMGVTTVDYEGFKVNVYDKDRLICEVLKYEDKMDREDFKRAILSYINDNDRNTGNFLDFANRRRVIRKARATVGIWL